MWLRKQGNRDSTVERKLKFLKGLSGDFESMVGQVLSAKWVDKSKALALKVVQQRNGLGGNSSCDCRYGRTEGKETEARTSLYDLDYTTIPVQWGISVTFLVKSHVPGARCTLKASISLLKMLEHRTQETSHSFCKKPKPEVFRRTEF